MKSFCASVLLILIGATLLFFNPIILLATGWNPSTEEWLIFRVSLGALIIVAGLTARTWVLKYF